MQFIDLKTDIVAVVVSFLTSGQGINLKVALVQDPWDITAINYPFKFTTTAPIPQDIHYSSDIARKIKEEMNRRILLGEYKHILEHPIYFLKKKFPKKMYKPCARVELFNLARDCMKVRGYLGTHSTIVCGCPEPFIARIRVFPSYVDENAKRCKLCISMKERRENFMKEVEKTEQVVATLRMRIAKAEAKLNKLNAKKL